MGVEYVFEVLLYYDILGWMDEKGNEYEICDCIYGIGLYKSLLYICGRKV